MVWLRRDRASSVGLLSAKTALQGSGSSCACILPPLVGCKRLQGASRVSYDRLLFNGVLRGLESNPLDTWVELRHHASAGALITRGGRFEIEAILRRTLLGRMTSKTTFGKTYICEKEETAPSILALPLRRSAAMQVGTRSGYGHALTTQGWLDSLALILVEDLFPLS